MDLNNIPNFILKVPEDMTELYDDEGNILMGEEGKPMQALDLWSYCEFFALNIQKKEELETGVHYDGMSLLDFCSVFDERYWQNNAMVDFLNQDFGFGIFQREMSEKYNIHVNIFALCVLCYFVSEIVQNKYVWLLAPTIKDTLEEIKEFDSISFDKKGKSIHSTSNREVLECIKEALTALSAKENKYSVYKVVKRDEIYTKEMMQGAFVYYISHFFNQFFKINRRSGGIVSVIEQKFILYLLCKFGLSTKKIDFQLSKKTGKPEYVISIDRYRQLKAIPEHKLFLDNWQELPVGEDGKKIAFQFEIIKYKSWKKGKINILKDSVESLLSGDRLSFSGEDLKSALLNR